MKNANGTFTNPQWVIASSKCTGKPIPEIPADCGQHNHVSSYGRTVRHNHCSGPNRHHSFTARMGTFIVDTQCELAPVGETGMKCTVTDTWTGKQWSDTSHVAERWARSMVEDVRKCYGLHRNSRSNYRQCVVDIPE